MKPDQYEIAVTEVTAYGPLYCVAGWDLTRKKMVRPEPPTTKPNDNSTKFWDATMAGRGRFFEVGNVVRFEASSPPQDFPFPHATEDRIISGNCKKQIVKKLSNEELLDTVSGSVSKNIDAIYSGKLIHAGNSKTYIKLGENINSLGAIEIQSNKMTLHEDTYPGKPTKLRARVYDKGIHYDLSVTSDQIKSFWRKNGIDEVKSRLGKFANAHLRIGLARPFDAMPTQCYTQINGIILY